MMYIVRHSERLDEQVSHFEYEQHIHEKLLEGEANEQNSDSSNGLSRSTLDPKLSAPYDQLYPIYRRRRNHHIYEDPPITVRGISIAEEAGKSLRQLISDKMWESFSSLQFPVIRVYASRLLRCVQTAYAVAKQLQVDTIYISAGLALTAAAVERLVRVENGFDHLNMDEICSICHDMVVFDCDHGVVYNNKKHDITVLSTSQTESNEDKQETEMAAEEVNNALPFDGKTHKYHVCTKDWHRAIQHISEHVHELNNSPSINFNEQSNNASYPIVCKVLVAHRETIRNLMNPYERLRLPYCCIAELFDVEGQQSDDQDEKRFALGKLFTPQGELMLDLTPEHIQPYNSTMAKL